MCWVIPPASPATTAVSRIASSSVVLPWSTWPMIVTTGGRSSSTSSASSKTSGSSSSSPTWRTVTSRPTSAAISSTDSSARDCVIWTISPRPIMILMICAAGMPSACERSRTVTPDGTVTGPVGWMTGCCDFGFASWRSPARWRLSPGRGRWLPLSMTTRRFLPPGPPPRGLMGLLGLPFAMCQGSSVETPQRRVDVDARAEHAVELPARRGALEARERDARVGPAPGSRALGQRAVLRVEAHELRLWRLAPAAHARPDRDAHSDPLVPRVDAALHARGVHDVGVGRPLEACATRDVDRRLDLLVDGAALERNARRDGIRVGALRLGGGRLGIGREDRLAGRLLDPRHGLELLGLRRHGSLLGRVRRKLVLLARQLLVGRKPAVA